MKTLLALPCPFVLSRLAGVTFILAAGTVGAYAQETNPYVPAPPADAQKVINGIGDLDILKALVPLKITEEQRDALLPIMKKYVTEAGETQRKADYAALRTLEPSVSKAREAALNGEPVSAETEAAMLKFFNSSEDQLKAARKAAVNALYPVARKMFTDEQKDEVERQVSRMLGGRRPVPAEYAKNPAKAPKEAVQDLALSTYLDRLFLLDRTVALLGKMKPAPKPEAKDADAKDAAGGAAAAAPEAAPTTVRP